MTDFEQQLQANMIAQIRAEKRRGTTGMSLDCLRQVTPTRNLHGLNGEILGTNAAYYYAETFAKIANATRTIKQFLI